MAITRVDVEHSAGDLVQTNIVKKQSWLFPFTPIGKRSMKNPESIDALDVICNFDKSELFVLSLVKARISPSHEVTLNRSSLSEGEQRKLQKGVKSFLDKTLMIRLKREHYMVNPYFLTPPLALQESIKAAWEAHEHPRSPLCSKPVDWA